MSANSEDQMDSNLTDDQIAALKLVDGTPFNRASDGYWYPVGYEGPQGGFTQECIRHLNHLKLIEMIPIGAIITDQGRTLVRNLDAG